jgi:hypothetical protein
VDLARFRASDLARPRTGLLDVTTTLADFAIVTFAVDPEKLAEHLAPGFEPDVYTLVDGSRVAFVSAVPFRDLDFRFGMAPFLRFHFGQINYRAYVTYRGERCVWFFGTSLATRWVFIPRTLWKLPWHHAQMSFDCAYEGPRCTRYALRTRGQWGDADVDLVGSGDANGCLDGFADDEDCAVVLTHPLAGYFFRRDSRVGSYSVWHDKLKLQRGVANKARFDVFERAGLVARDAKPHSVLITAATEFLVFLPPRAI